jgi:N6-L-threonylcarbamoyladenine synthase
MLILGVETSCDETAAAVLKDGSILSNVIYSQVEIHARYGGVVPELAGRSHLETIHTIIRSAIENAGVTLSDIDLIAVTIGPGLVCSLLVGINTAKGMAYALNKPIIGVNHLEGHMLAIFLHEKVEFPFMALIVSGGHTDLCRIDDFGSYRFLGRTRDDAAGECFDKVAKMMGLGYPGGPAIEKLARSGNPNAFPFPRAWLEKGSLDFSFSGLKTAVRNLLQKRREGKVVITDMDIAASFQEAVTDILVGKLMISCDREGLKRAVVTGGVAANGYLRERAYSAAQSKGIECHYPRKDFCTDNAAMIACAGYYRFRNHAPDNMFLLDAHASLPL